MANKPNKRKKNRPRPLSLPSGQRSSTDSSTPAPVLKSRRERESEPLTPLAEFSLGSSFLVGCVVAIGVLLYAYWPTLVWMEDAWRNEPDYSHGYLVLPLAAILCWSRLDTFPGIRSRLSWAGLSLLVLAVVMRVAGRLMYADFLDAWSLLPLIAGAVWLLAGPAALRWALPSIAFLFLMFPLPYRAESLLSWKLQGIATDMSTIMLRVLGQPAVAEGHVIWLGDERLLVEQACSGMRIFIGVFALAFFWAALTRRSWVDRVFLIVAAFPLAIVVNALRITTVGLLYPYFETAAARNSIHDLSGYLMIPLAFGLLYLLKVYWEHLYRPLERLTARDLVPGTA